MDKIKLLQLFEALYTDAKSNVVWMEKFIDGYFNLTNSLHELYDDCGIAHNHEEMEKFDAILVTARQKVEATRQLIYSVEHPNIPAESEGEDE